MQSEWHVLTDEAQLALTHAALFRAAETIAEQAELLAEEIDNGGLIDRGGAEALRMLATVVRGATDSLSAGAGHA